MKILYQIPSLESVYAARFIYEGYKNAFTDLGHRFFTLTSNDNLEEVIKRYRPDIFLYSINFYTLKFLDLEKLLQFRKRGLIVFCQVRAWNNIGPRNKPNSISGPLKFDSYQVSLIKSGLAGDVFWNWFENDSPAMEGFSKTTGRQFNSILLAADKIRFFYDFDENYKYDICYVGSYLNSKKQFIDKHINPLRRHRNVKIYGSDWTFFNRGLGIIQKVGQFFNIDFFKNVRTLPLSMDEERKLYSSSTISLNVHEDYVRQNNLEINERTFKVMASGGFEISDNVGILRKYFSKDELIIGKNTKDWFEKVEYYLKNPEKRIPIINRGMKKVLKYHTYHNRVKQILNIYNNLKK